MDINEFLESEFLTCEYVRTSTTKKATILSSGTKELSQDGKTKKLQLLVEIDGKQKFWKLNKASLKNLKEKFGTDSNLYIGKVVGLSLQTLQGGKEGIVGTPLA